MSNVKIHIKLFSLAFIALVLQSQVVDAQINHIHSQNIGMGGSATAYTQNYQAIFTNPANLMFNDRDTQASFGFSGIGVGIGGPLANISLYNEYFTTGRHIQSDKAIEISERWFGSDPNSFSRLGSQVDVVPLGLHARIGDQAFGFAVRSRVISSVEMNQGLSLLGLTGFNSDIFEDFVPVSTVGEVISTVEVAFSYARKIWESDFFILPGSHSLHAGVTPVYVMGMGYASFGMESNLRIRELEEDLTHEYDIFLNTTGSLSAEIDRYVRDVDDAQNSQGISFGSYLGDGLAGLGSPQARGLQFNFGLTYEWNRGEIAPSDFWGNGQNILRLSLTTKDIGSLNFTDDPRNFSSNGTLQWNGINIDRERIDNEFNGSRSDYISYVLTDSLANEVYLDFQSESVNGFRVQTNPAVNLGAAYTYGRATAVFDIGKGFSNTGMINNRVYAAFGGEYLLIDKIPIRAGIRTGGFNSTLYSFGTGVNLRQFEFSVGAMSRPNSGSRGNAIVFAWSGFQFRL